MCPEKLQLSRRQFLQRSLQLGQLALFGNSLQFAEKLASHPELQSLRQANVRGDWKLLFLPGNHHISSTLLDDSHSVIMAEKSIGGSHQLASFVYPHSRSILSPSSPSTPDVPPSSPPPSRPTPTPPSLLPQLNLGFGGSGEAIQAHYQTLTDIYTSPHRYLVSLDSLGSEAFYPHQHALSNQVALGTVMAGLHFPLIRPLEQFLLRRLSHLTPDEFTHLTTRLTTFLRHSIPDHPLIQAADTISRPLPSLLSEIGLILPTLLATKSLNDWFLNQNSSGWDLPPFLCHYIDTLTNQLPTDIFGLLNPHDQEIFQSTITTRNLNMTLNALHALSRFSWTEPLLEPHHPLTQPSTHTVPLTHGLFHAELKLLYLQGPDHIQTRLRHLTHQTLTRYLEWITSTPNLETKQSLILDFLLSAREYSFPTTSNFLPDPLVYPSTSTGIEILWQTISQLRHQWPPDTPIGQTLTQIITPLLDFTSTTLRFLSLYRTGPNSPQSRGPFSTSNFGVIDPHHLDSLYLPHQALLSPSDYSRPYFGLAFSHGLPLVLAFHPSHTAWNIKTATYASLLVGQSHPHQPPASWTWFNFHTDHFHLI